MLTLYAVPLQDPTAVNAAPPPLTPPTMAGCNGCTGAQASPTYPSMAPAMLTPTAPAGAPANVLAGGILPATSSTSSTSSTGGAAPCDACKRSMWAVALAVGAVVLVIALVARR